MDEIKVEIPFFQVPNEIFNQNLKTYELLVYIYLCRCGNNSSAFPSYNDIAEKCGMSRPKAIDTIKVLIDKGLITKHKRDNTSNMYKVEMNFTSKGDLPVVNEVYPASKGDLPQVVNEVYPPSKQRLPKKELIKKNYFKEELFNNICLEIIEHLNKKTNGSYKVSSKKTQKLIHARINEGFSKENFITVIDKKCSDWHGTEYEKYLRPETLFGNKFEGYLNQKFFKKKQDNFNEYNQRKYDYSDLEKKLLGWQEDKN